MDSQVLTLIRATGPDGAAITAGDVAAAAAGVAAATVANPAAQVRARCSRRSVTDSLVVVTTTGHQARAVSAGAVPALLQLLDDGGVCTAACMRGGTHMNCTHATHTDLHAQILLHRYCMA